MSRRVSRLLARLSAAPAAVLLLLMLGLAAPTARADIYDDYEAGVKAAERGDWATVQRLMGGVAREADQVGRVRLYGTRFIELVPHYYLGQAELNLGNCRAALAAFRNSAHQQGMQHPSLRAKLGEQQRLEAQCEQRMAQQQQQQPPAQAPATVAQTDPAPAQPRPAEPPPQRPTPAEPRPAPQATPSAEPRQPALPASAVAALRSRIEQAQARVGEIERMLAAAPLRGSGDARALGSELGRQKQAIDGAANNLRSARTSQELERIGDGVDGNLRSLATLAGRVEAARDGLVQAEQARQLELARTRARDSLGNADSRLAEAREAGVAASALSAVEQARQRLQSAIGGNDANAIEQAGRGYTEAVRQLDQAIAAAPKPAPAELRRQLGLFIAGQLQQVASWNGPDQLPEARDRALGLLLRAAARYRLYVTGGEADTRLLAQVDADLREAKRLDRNLKPSEKLYSPRLLERFRGV